MGDLEYIRDYYQVPAYRGARVRYTGGEKPVEGTITGGSGPYIRVRFDDRKLTVRLHPKWNVEYLSQRTIPE